MDWTEAKIFEALEICTHPGPDKWTLVPQLPDATSFDKRRTVDAMAFACWKSDGIAVHGYEIKVARGDWLREIQKPDKSQGFSRRCNYWWIAAPEGVVKVEELPSDWGLRIVKWDEQSGYSVRVKRPATFRPDPVFDVGFVVALARACYRKSPDRLADKAQLKAEYERGYDEGVRSVERASIGRDALDERNELREAIAKFEAASGIQIRSWDAEPMGEAFKYFLRLGGRTGVGFLDIVRQLEEMLNAARVCAGLIGADEVQNRKKRR